MNTTGRENVGACAPEFLFASSRYPVSKVLMPVASGEGKLKRGTALALNTAGKCVILGTKETVSEKQVLAEAAYILAEDVDATDADVMAEVYRSGHFIKNALVVKEDYSMTDADVEAFRKAGIMLDNGIVE
nr:MAG TPA: Head decoration protein [Caudoviricetes sp.]